MGIAMLAAPHQSGSGPTLTSPSTLMLIMSVDWGEAGAPASSSKQTLVTHSSHPQQTPYWTLVSVLVSNPVMCASERMKIQVSGKALGARIE
jgi:hypothetical protein